MRIQAAATFLLLFCLSPVPAAAERTFIDEPEPITPSSVREREPWKEQAVDLPPWPRDQDLVEFELDTRTPFRYFIDAKNLRTGADGVVRYTLVAESRSGTRNVSFEGLRCTPKGTYRVYAYGANGRFEAVTGENWQSATTGAGDQLHRELHGHFLCGPMTFEPRPKKDMVRALRGNIRSRENTGFLPD